MSPWVYRLTPRWLDWFIEDKTGMARATPFYPVNIAAEFLALILFVVYLRHFMQTPGIRLLVLTMWMAEWWSPARWLYFCSVNVEPVFIAFVLAALLLIQAAGDRLSPVSFFLFSLPVLSARWFARARCWWLSPFSLAHRPVKAGDVDTERILGWAAPVAYVLLGRSFEHNRRVLSRAPLLVGVLCVTQIVSERILWAIPIGPNNAHQFSTLDLNWASAYDSLDRLVIIDDHYGNLEVILGQSHRSWVRVLAFDVSFAIVIAVCIGRRSRVTSV